MHPKFLQLLADRYVAIKSQYPNDGRRGWHLRVLEEFWANENRKELISSSLKLSPDLFAEDDDPLDELLEGPELGVLIRTDFTNEDAWTSFSAKLDEEEKEFAKSMKSEAPELAANAEIPPSGSGHEIRMEDGESDSGSSTDGIPSPLIKIINPSLPQERAIFDRISNLTALRLFNDVDIRPSLIAPSGTARISPPNRLVDHGGWQEIYTGVNLWIYDATSNTDQCVRLVGQDGGGIYGTATGDSWRARGTHICELQFNMSYLGMKIDFGGLDRWDFGERRRNMDEATKFLTEHKSKPETI
ncbi:hypothetical protein BDZ94DRAFT_1025884 [Collybia nuda]|uniref:Uncharacterized protein n=1 Tax=Collybia nuda TaxID=64659 RepID=A0A9P5YC76_9AGAR|nr:hypothetical protein BDZ94DRAFT_1025884 [Collybia nuda]